MVIDLSPVKSFKAKWGITDPSPNSSELDNTIDNYLLSCTVEGKSVLTISSYRQRLTLFRKFAADNSIKRPAAVTGYQVRLFLLSLKEQELGPSTLNAYYRVLKTFFNWSVAERIIREDHHPMQNIKPPQLPKKTPQPFSHPDIDRLLLVTSGKRFVDVRNRALVLAFIDTGLRLAEMSHIQLNDIDFDAETIKVMGKGSKERVVGISKKTQKALLRYMFLRNDDYSCLWINENRKPLTRDGVQDAIETLCIRAEIKDAKPGPHTFRHYFGTDSLRNGADIREVQTLLGHSTLSTTLRYVNTVKSEDAVKSHRRFSPVDRLNIS